MQQIGKLAVKLGLACVLTSAIAVSHAASYPSGPVTLVVPTGAGGGTDLAARAMSSKLAEVLGQPVIIDNKAGAGGIIGNQAVARAKPDGYTLLISSNQFGIIPAVQTSLPYDPLKDFVPITSIGVIPTLVLLNPAQPFKTMQELIAFSKQKPGALRYASAGVGSPNHLFAAMFNQMVGTDIMHIPFKGTAAALMAVAGGEVELSFASYPASKGYLEANKLKAIAVTSKNRLAGLDQYPPIADTVAGYEADIWLGIWGVAGTPPAVVDTIHAALVKTLDDPKVRESLSGMGLVVQTRSHNEFSAMVNDELAKWKKVVDDSKGEIQRQ